jgi:hypothetical protein
VRGTSSSAEFFDGCTVVCIIVNQSFDGGVAARALFQAADMQHVAFTSGVTDGRKPDVFCARSWGDHDEKDDLGEGCKGVGLSMTTDC